MHLLSNSRYTTLIDAAGAGYSVWRDCAITRWREDPVTDSWGSYLLLRDEETGAVWSATAQPCGADPGTYSVSGADGRVVIGHQRGGLTTTLEVAVVADSDAELRRLTISNRGDRARLLTLTSYAELVLASAAADAAHPAFSKMFVQTQWVDHEKVLLATRRRRTPGESEVWAAHWADIDIEEDGLHEFETDRARFLGRCRTLRQAQAMRPGIALGNSSGCVLDPVFSVRRGLTLAPGASVTVAFWTAAANSRDGALALVHALRARGACEQVFAGAQARSRAEQVRFGVAGAQVARFNALAAALVQSDSRLRAPAATLERAAGGMPVLWACGISGDRPIVLARVVAESDLACVDELLLAQRFWQSQRLGADVVLLDAGPETGNVHAALDERLRAQNARLQLAPDAAKASLFVLRDSAITASLRDGLAMAARVVFDAAAGLPTGESADAGASQAASPAATDAALRARASIETLTSAPETAARQPAPSMREFDNGTGAFVEAGRTYSIILGGEQCTPAPWVNVIANESFGFMVSAEGGGYTWSLNSQQNPLTPWPNDPVSDTPHEALYLRDLDSGDLWSAQALPIRVPEATYAIDHGKGYSRFVHVAHGIEVDLLQFVPAAEAVKISRLSLCNRTSRTRRLSVTAFVEWALGPNGAVAAPFVVTSIDASTKALLARNAWRPEFAERVAFIDLGGRQHSCTGDRLEFLGRHGSVDHPAALAGGGMLSGRTGAALDPCGALQTSLELAPGARIEVVFLLGDAGSQAEASALIARYRTADLDAALREARAQWDGLLDTVQVRTPNRAMDIVLNDWLLYQALGCRVWARTAYYQASGAYGFRDQLQDVMSLCVARPDIARAQLLRAAGRQFVEGDVQHWWLPPAGRGIRTRMSDDLIWLAYVAVHYIATTGDAAVLDESLPFLDGPAVPAGEAEAFYQPGVSSEHGTLYEHAARALDRSLTAGAHGLPLIGTGDWNDGMNNVGAEGKGESVWLGWFLLTAIDAFAPIADARGEKPRAAIWRTYAGNLRNALDSSAGWDGHWYRRGYYDDGSPLGSQLSEECKIDAIAQSWSVMSGAGTAAHAAQAMDAVWKHLVLRAEKVALLFTPPFDQTPLNPGYIKGYPPGIRENGGQYTHAATWSVFAYAMLGQGDRAGEIFDILNPILHSDNAEAAARYRVEPYVVCADVYSVAPYVGRGGWTWYTGSSGWLYRAGLEAILGFHLRGDHLLLSPCIPAAWPRYELTYRHRGSRGTVTIYEISVENPNHVHRGIVNVELDGVPQAASAPGVQIALSDDGRPRRVRVVLG